MVDMARPTKTASELEQMILALVHDEMICPGNLQIKVLKVDGRWDAFPEFIGQSKYPDCLAHVVRIATELRAQFDLAQ
jgi:hypothetical protein